MRGRLPYLTLALTVLGGLFHPSLLWAGMEDCRFALHWQAATTKLSTLCTTYSPNANSIPCQSYVTSAPIQAASHVYMVVAHGGNEGIAGASFGINYHGGRNDPPGTGIDPRLVTVTWCSDGLVFPAGGEDGDFPKPEGAVRVTWNNETSCQVQVNGDEGVHAVIGALYCYAYSADQLQLTTNDLFQSGTELTVDDCAGITTDLYEVWGSAVVHFMGRVDFGEGPGYNPCHLIIPTAASTWGKMKSMYPEATVPARPKTNQ